VLATRARGRLCGHAVDLGIASPPRRPTASLTKPLPRSRPGQSHSFRGRWLFRPECRLADTGRSRAPSHHADASPQGESHSEQPSAGRTLDHKCGPDPTVGWYGWWHGPPTSGRPKQPPDSKRHCGQQLADRAPVTCRHRCSPPMPARQTVSAGWQSGLEPRPSRRDSTAAPLTAAAQQDPHRPARAPRR
jgi:hypothetical protein